MFSSSKESRLFLILILFIFSPFSTVMAYGSNSNVLVRVLADQVKHKSSEQSSYNISLLYQNKYHNLSEVYEELRYFNVSAPKLIDYSHIGYSYYGNKIPLITLTNEEVSEEYKSKTYYVAHHHAREMCTIEEVLRLIRDLINDYGEDPDTTSLLNRIIIYFIVTLNPDSLDYTLYQNEHFRKSMKPYDDDNDGSLDEDGPKDMNNDSKISEYWVYNTTNTGVIAHWIEGEDVDNDGQIGEDPPGGVDLNRNYPFHWNDSSSNTGSTSDKTSFTYPGLKAFSENETSVLDNFVQLHNFTHALSLHSGIATLCYGWSWTHLYQQPEQAIYDSFATYIKDEGLLPNSFFPLDRIDYTCAGEWGDYMYTEYKIIPMTLEIYGRPDRSKLILIEENEKNKTYERKYEDFKAFNPPAGDLEDLHFDLLKFNKIWIALTPKITVSSITNKSLPNGNNEITINLRSGSLYWNSTDRPTIKVTSTQEGAIKDFTNEIPVLLPNEDHKLKILLSGDIPDSLNIQINISSEWASDLFISLEIASEDFKQASGFSLISSILILVLLEKIRRNKKSR
ncbi:MAG: M14 family zinc carboxypeptidase [Candidatus Hodarchaeales archaeon]